MKLLWGKCYRWQLQRPPLYSCLSKVKLSPPQDSPMCVPLLPGFPAVCSRCLQPQEPPEWGMEGSSAPAGPHAALSRMPVGAERQPQCAETCSPFLHQSCRARLSVPLRKHGWGISEGSLIRPLLFPNSWQCWSVLAWARQQPGCWWWILGEVDVLPWHWEVSPHPTAPAAESAPSSMS